MAGDQKGKLPDVTDEMPTLPQGAAKEGSANGEASAAEEAASTGEDSAKGEASAAEAASTGEDSAKDAARATEDAAGQISDQAVTLKKPQGKIQLAPDAADDVVPAHGAAQTQPGDPGPELPRAGAPVQKTMPSRTRVLEPQGAKAPPSPEPSRSPVATVAIVALLVGVVAGGVYFLTRGGDAATGASKDASPDGTATAEAAGKSSVGSAPADQPSGATAGATPAAPDPTDLAGAQTAGNTGEAPAPPASAGAQPTKPGLPDVPGWVTSALPTGLPTSLPTSLPSAFPPVTLPSQIPPFPGQTPPAPAPSANK